MWEREGSNALKLRYALCAITFLSLFFYNPRAIFSAEQQTDSLLPPDVPSDTVRIAPEGHSIARIRVNDQDALVAMPSCGACADTTMTFSRIEDPQKSDVESFALTFSKDATFAGYPSFSVSASQSLIDSAPSRKFLLVFDDGSESVAFWEDSYRFGSLKFVGGFFTNFHALANQTYHARLIIASNSTSDSPRLQDSRGLCVQGNNTVTTCLDFTKGKGGSTPSKFTALTELPTGISPLADADLKSTPCYLSFDASSVSSKDAIISFIVPLSRDFNARDYNIAWHTGPSPGSWHKSLSTPFEREGDLVRVHFHFPSYNSAPDMQNGALIALYSQSPLGSENRPATAPIIAVLGDSVSVLTVLPQNPLGCIASNEAPNHCVYSSDANLNYPGVVAQLTGATVLNFSLMNASQTTVDRLTNNVVVKSWLHSSVLQIPADSTAVILEPGIADLGQNNGDPQTSSRLPTLVDAVLARAPQAKIVFIGLRCCGAGNEAWNTEEQNLAKRYGAYVDRRDSAPDGVSTKTPDGLHCSPEYARELGASIVTALKSLAI